MKLRAFLIYQEMLGIWETKSILRGMVSLPPAVHYQVVALSHYCQIVSVLRRSWKFDFFPYDLAPFEIVN